MFGFAHQPYRLGHLTRPLPAAAIEFPVYVDSEAPDGGDGSELTPYNNLNTAMLAVMGRVGAEIHVRAPEHAPIRQQPVPFESTVDLIIQGWNDQPWYCYGSEQVSNWVLVGNGIWKTPLDFTVVNIAVVPTLTQTVVDRDFYWKLLYSDTPTSPDQGEIGYVNNELFIRLPYDENPNEHVIEVAKRNNAFRAYGFANLTVRHLHGRCFLSSAIANGLSTNPAGTGTLTVEDSTIEYTGLNGVTAQAQNEQTICTRVECYRCTNDGFNHRRLSGEGLMVLNGCKGSYNGDRPGESSQGCSNHSDSKMVVNGGEYNHNVSGGMVSVDSGTIDLHGDTEYGPILMDGNMRLGNTAGTIAGQAGCAWLNGTSGVVTGDVTVSNGLGVGVRVATPGNVSGVENINSVNNAFPDQF